MEKRNTFTSLTLNDLRSLKNIPFLEVLNEKNLCLYTVSSMLNFLFDKDPLQCSSILKHKLLEQMKQCEVNFEQIKGMDYCLPALGIKVMCHNKLKYESVCLSLSDLNGIQNKSSNVMLLCVTQVSSRVMTKTIHATLEKIYNCVISSCHVSNNNFLWLTGICIKESLIRKKNDGMNISFSLPYFTQNASIHLQLTQESLENVWLSSCAEPKSTKLNWEEIDLFYHGLLEHIKNTYGLDLKQCSIRAVALNGIKFTSSEKFHMVVSSKEILLIVLMFLYSDCIH